MAVPTAIEEARTKHWTEVLDREFLTCVKSPHLTRSLRGVELNRSAHEPLDVSSLSQDRVLDGARSSIANNSPDGGESMQGLAEMIQTAIGN
jgi:hypothetical protein